MSSSFMDKPRALDVGRIARSPFSRPQDFEFIQSYDMPLSFSEPSPEISMYTGDVK